MRRRPERVVEIVEGCLERLAWVVALDEVQGTKRLFKTLVIASRTW